MPHLAQQMIHLLIFSYRVGLDRGGNHDGTRLAGIRGYHFYNIDHRLDPLVGPGRISFLSGIQGFRHIATLSDGPYSDNQLRLTAITRRWDGFIMVMS